MEAVFTLPYSEYMVINHMQKIFKKGDGYSIYMPVSRQQKGVDFILHNSRNNKILRFQVKSSRAYIDDPKILKNGKIKTSEFKYYLWLSNFVEKYNPGNADYYIIYGLFPVYKGKINEKNKCWKSLYLCYKEQEMFGFLERVVSKENKIQPYFSYGFNNDKQIFSNVVQMKKPPNIY